MESLFANRIRDYNGMVLQAFKNISIISYSDIYRQSALVMSKIPGLKCLAYPSLGRRAQSVERPSKVAA